MCQMRLEFPDEETEDVDDHAHLVTSIFVMRLNDSSHVGFHVLVFVLIYIPCVNTSSNMLGLMTSFLNHWL